MPDDMKSIAPNDKFVKNPDLIQSLPPFEVVFTNFI